MLLDGHRDYSDKDGNVGTGVCWLLPESVADDFVLIRDMEREVHYLTRSLRRCRWRWTILRG